MMSLQEISDRLEIQDLMVRYAHAVDSRDWKLFAGCFTGDAVIDYSAFGGPRGGVEEVVDYLSTVLPMFTATQHLMANCAVELDGDRATARTMCQNPMALPGEEGEYGLLSCGLWYTDELVRTPEGWRLSDRSQQKAYAIALKPPPAEG